MPGSLSVNDGPGLFGKTPETGDFVSRNLSQFTRRALDGWVTAHLAIRHEGWPAGGLRGLLEIDNSRQLLMLAVPSSDKAGRRFPLVAVTDGKGLSLEDADAWCTAGVLYLDEASIGLVTIDQTFAKICEIEPATRNGPIGIAALWVAGEDPLPFDTKTIEELFSSG